MTVYIPRQYTGDEATARRLIADFPFALLVTGSAGGVHVSHLPLLLEDGSAALFGHMARANPHWKAFDGGTTLAIFQGPHAFVSRGWYRDPAGHVPTWNYAAVHVTGKPAIAGPEETRSAVERLSARFEEPGLPQVTEDGMQRRLKAIVAFRLPVERLEVKFKMSQNETAELAGIIAALKATGRHDELATAQWMEHSGKDGHGR